MITPKNWKVSAVAIIVFGLLLMTVCLATPASAPDNEDVESNSSASTEQSNESSNDVSTPETSLPNPEESETSEETIADDSVPESDTTDVSEPDPEESIPETSDDELIRDPQGFPNDPPETEEESELPDVIEVDVKFYNWESTGFNLVDGAKYCEDIALIMQKYAPEGLHISAGVAMAYTEGGAGKKGVYASTNNCFGIRAYSNWDGYVYSRTTGIVYKDWETACKYRDTEDTFRAYDCMEDSVKDYCALISGSHYNHCFTMESNEEYLKYILSQGYGEAHLADTWLYLIDLYDLEQYDVVKTPDIIKPLEPLEPLPPVRDENDESHGIQQIAP